MKISAPVVATALATLSCVLAACGSSGISAPASTSPVDASISYPYAGTFYPIYDSGPSNPWITPTDTMPFNKVSTVFAAFAHAYPRGRGAILSFERGQPEQAMRLRTLAETARKKNPKVKVLVSLGWEHNDWTYISNDYVHNAGLFIPSVIQLVRENRLDGFDIDDEGIGGSTGNISQAAFDGVIANLRSALDAASRQDGRAYYLTITPAGNNSGDGLERTQVDAQNAGAFNLINIQSYYSQTWGSDFLSALKSIGYPLANIAPGITTDNCAPIFPKHAGLGGMFNWTLSADSACGFKYTRKLAREVGY